MAEEKRAAGPSKKGEENEGPAVAVFKFDQSRAPAFSDDTIEPDSALAGGELCQFVLGPDWGGRLAMLGSCCCCITEAMPVNGLGRHET